MAFEEIIFLPEALKCQGSLAVFCSLLAAQIEKAKSQIPRVNALKYRVVEIFVK